MGSAATHDLVSARHRIEFLERALAQRTHESEVNQAQAETVYRYLLGLSQAIPGAIVSIAASGAIVRCNPVACELLGYDDTQLIGDPIESIWPDFGTWVTRLGEHGNGVVRGEAQWISARREPIVVLASTSATHDEDGRLSSVVCVAMDLRRYKKLEVELRHAQKLESLGQLAAGIAHEINTPMQFISDNLHYLKEVADENRWQDETTQCGQALDAALDGVTRVSHIVEAMRSFSHPQTNPTAVDLRKTLEDTLVVASHEYKYVASVETDFGDVPPVQAHGGDLHQVFLNLIVNAAQAIAAKHPAGTRGHIRIGCRREGDQAHVEIGDDGIGIPESIRDRVFDPFFTTKEVGKGTGQGLAIARTIVVDRHHGRLDFESGAQGTVFHVRLPLAGSPTARAST